MRLISFKHPDGPARLVAPDGQGLPGPGGRGPAPAALLERAVRAHVRRCAGSPRPLAQPRRRHRRRAPVLPHQVPPAAADPRALEDHRRGPELPATTPRAAQSAAARARCCSSKPTCLQADRGPILLDPDLTQVDAEAELAVVIGRAGRRISRADAPAHIAGYMCCRRLGPRGAAGRQAVLPRQKPRHRRALRLPGSSRPTSCPLADGLGITGTLNGEVVQRSNTDQLIFPIDGLIRFASLHMTLLPGDIITTGTPGGVGVYRDPPLPAPRRRLRRHDRRRGAAEQSVVAL
ncbi:MAG: fumarylacetoacetate hydrolase family protein [bacterium]|nr:fumarylacetoacetate hydrolase family protein [bacterium]